MAWRRSPHQKSAWREKKKGREGRKEREKKEEEKRGEKGKNLGGEESKRERSIRLMDVKHHFRTVKRLYKTRKEGG